MDASREIIEIFGELSPERQVKLLDFARELGFLQERQDWFEAGQHNLERCYSDDEPEYTLADCIELPEESEPSAEE